ncbi:hypothetical protein PENTCL1PPCAC_19374, partial [Pristionchus entomophagus]
LPGLLVSFQPTFLSMKLVHNWISQTFLSSITCSSLHASSTTTVSRHLRSRIGHLPLILFVPLTALRNADDIADNFFQIRYFFTSSICYYFLTKKRLRVRSKSL